MTFILEKLLTGLIMGASSRKITELILQMIWHSFTAIISRRFLTRAHTFTNHTVQVCWTLRVQSSSDWCNETSRFQFGVGKWRREIKSIHFLYSVMVLCSHRATLAATSPFVGEINDRRVSSEECHVPLGQGVKVKTGSFSWRSLLISPRGWSHPGEVLKISSSVCRLLLCFPPSGEPSGLPPRRRVLPSAFPPLICFVLSSKNESQIA